MTKYKYKIILKERLINIDKKYNIIYADPPWNYNKGVYQDNNRPERKINEQYNTMTFKELKELPIKNISYNDCALFLWVTDSHLEEGLKLIKEWGFKYKTIAFVWIKKTRNGALCSNVGAWTMKNTEICLLATKGNMLKYKLKNNIKQLVEAERTIHSKKPDEVRDRIEQLFGNLPRIELFARQKVEGWDVWGNEVESDIHISVDKI